MSSQELAHFVAELRFEQIPSDVLRRCEDLLLDTLGSIFAGSTERPIKTIERFAIAQGPESGNAQILASGRTTSPLFATMVNAAAAHMVEQDDLHNSAVFHPACVVFPPALAVAQSLGAAGLWEFLRSAADSKQLHTAKAAANGLMAAYLAQDGFTGAKQILEGGQGMGAGMSTDADPRKLTDRLGSRWALLETSFKYHASCRHTHPSADALLAVLQDNQIKTEEVAEVITYVHQAALDVLGAVQKPATVHQSKFSMGTVLGIVAYQQFAGVDEFDRALGDSRIEAFRQKVTMQLDPEVDDAYPNRWLGKVSVKTTDGREFSARVDEPKGDPGNTLNRAEIEAKVERLMQYRAAATPPKAREFIDFVWGLEQQDKLGAFK